MAASTIVSQSARDWKGYVAMPPYVRGIATVLYRTLPYVQYQSMKGIKGFQGAAILRTLSSRRMETNSRYELSRRELTIVLNRGIKKSPIKKPE